MQSIVSYPDRGAGGDARYRGNFSPRLVADLLGHFRPKQVADPMGGSYTTRDVCARLGVPCWSSDLRDGFDLLGDEIPVGADLGILHPPYSNMILYSGAVWGEQADPRDLSRCPDYWTFIKRLNEAQYRLYESLRRGGHMAVLVGDLRRAGEFYPIQRDMSWYGQPVSEVVKLQHNTTSSRTDYSGRFIPIVHEYLIITRKPEVWMVAVRETQPRHLDARKFAGMTWRALTQAVLEALSGSAPLQDIYRTAADTARVEQCRRDGQDWQAQIRRALQVYPDTFKPVERGVWSLAGAA